MKNINMELDKLEALVGEEIKDIKKIQITVDMSMEEIFDKYNGAINRISSLTPEVWELLKQLEVKLFGKTHSQIIHYGVKRYFESL